jgi:TP901 family phage tail tape measure protein
MAITADRVIVELEAKLDKYKREIAEGDRKFDQSMKNIRRNAGVAEAQTTKSFNAIGRASKQMGDSLRTSALALATVAGAGAGVRVLADFAQAMSTVRAVAQATDSQFEALEKRARELGASTRFSATQAAEGMLFLARAGFDTEQVLGSIEGTLQLAQAGNMDLGRAADIASNVLQGFRLEVADTARVVDVLALASNSSNTDVTQLGEAMKYAAPIAAGLGVGVEDTAAAVSALSDAGLQGQMAGTGLRRVMIGLEKQSSQGEKVLKKYDLTMQDIALGSTGSLAESLNRLAEAGISTADAMTLFGLRGGPAFEVLQSSIPKVRELTSAYEEAGGTAERIAEVMDANLNGALLATKSRLEELILALGDAGAEDGLIIALESVQSLLVLAAENADILSVAIIALTIRAMLPMAAAVVGRALPALATLSTSLQLLTVRGGAALVATRALAGGMALLNPATLIIIAAAAAFITLARNAREGREAIDRARQSIDGLNSALDATSDFAAFEALKNDASFAIPVMNQLRDAVGEIADEIQRVASATVIQQAAEISRQVETAKTALDDLERRRERVLVSRGASTSAFGSTGGVQGDSGRATEFDSEITALKIQIAAAERRFEAIGSATFGQDGVDIVEAFRDGGIEAVERALNKRFTEITNASVIEKELENVKALTTALEDAKGKGLDRAADRFSEQIAIAEETIRLLQSGLDESTARGLATETVREGRGTGGGLDKQTKKALEEIRSAYQDTFETEREQIRRIRDERLAAIDAAAVGEAKAAELRQQANDIHDQQLRDLRAQEAEDFDAYLDEQQAKIDSERNLVEEISRARDEMLGRTSALLEREYELKRAQIDKEIEDAARKNEAIAALDEEYAARRQDLEDKALGNGQYSENEIERINEIEAEKLKVLEDWYQENLDREQEYLDRRKEINAEAEAAITDLKQNAAVAQLDAAERGFDAAADLAKKFAGENKGIYKALFLAEKAAALASAYVQMNLAVAKAAAAAPPPFNAPLIASAKVTGIATIAGIAASAITGFESGGYTGDGGRKQVAGVVHGKEFVANADATARNRNVLEQMNRGLDVEAQLARINQPVAITPSFMTTGGRTVQIGGAQLNFNGPVDRDTIPELRAMVEQLSADQESRISAAIAADKVATTPRYQRNKFIR